MWFLNNFLNKIFDLFFSPFREVNPLWGLSIISFLTGIVMLIIFRYTSNQEGIKEAKEKIKAHLLEVRLFKDDMGLILNAQKNILKHNFTYMKYSVMPMLVMMIPVVLILIQLNFRFGYSPLKPGDDAIVVLNMNKGINVNGIEAKIITHPGIEVETPILRIDERKEVDWRIRAKEYGNFDLEFQIGGEKFHKSVKVTDKLTMISPKRVSSGFFDLIFNPAEKPIKKNSVVESIEIRYSPTDLNVFGYKIHWLVIFFVLSIAFGFAFKGVFGVQV
ncbi:MAG: hypothetical protein A2043_02325 [Candidatus Schekmanbacteria bacterium GWA2_38_9]|nr:MAG: hypothetical protein A2043_02325 [Candidatus Schekmanbacteria bacterium GWA2_38_9]